MKKIDFSRKNFLNLKRKKSGFSLIELSLVIIIIAIIIVAIVSGQALVTNSKLVSTSSVVKKIRIAATTFQEIYGYLPGDISEGDSTIFEKKGDGNGFVGDGSPLNSESINFFTHLSKTKLIEENYEKTAAPSSVTALNSDYYPETKFKNVYLYMGASDLGNNFNRINRMMVVTSDTSSPVINAKVALKYNCKFDNCDPVSGNIVSVNVKYEN